MREEEVPAREKYNAEFVAQKFVQIYYKILSDRPEDLYRFYKEESQSSFAEGPGDPPVILNGEQAIQELPRLDFKESKFENLGVDCQWSTTDSVALLVCGRVVRKFESGEGRRFVQSFVLSPQTQGWYVRNDMFRFVDPLRANSDSPQQAELKPGEHDVGSDVTVGSEANALNTEHLPQSNVRPTENGPSKLDETAVRKPASKPAKNEQTTASREPRNQKFRTEQVSAPTEAELAGWSPSVDPVATAGAATDQQLEPEPSTGQKFSYASIVAKLRGETPSSAVPVQALPEAHATPNAQPEPPVSSPPASGGGEMADDKSPEALNEDEAPAPGASPYSPPGIYLNQLHHARTVDSTELTEILLTEFTKYGPVQSVDVRLPRGFAFINYETDSAVSAAVEAWREGAPQDAPESIARIRVQVRRPPPRSNTPRPDRGGSGSARGGVNGRGRGRAGRPRGEGAEAGEDTRRSGRGGSSGGARRSPPPPDQRYGQGYAAGKKVNAGGPTSS